MKLNAVNYEWYNMKAEIDTRKSCY